jgi:hypothetical protein
MHRFWIDVQSPKIITLKSTRVKETTPLGLFHHKDMKQLKLIYTEKTFFELVLAYETNTKSATWVSAKLFGSLGSNTLPLNPPNEVFLVSNAV